jgi:hypothetical protein
MVSVGSEVRFAHPKTHQVNVYYLFNAMKTPTIPGKTGL